jgi:hypothetical protein
MNEYENFGPQIFIDETLNEDWQDGEIDHNYGHFHPYYRQYGGGGYQPGHPGMPPGQGAPPSGYGYPPSPQYGGQYYPPQQGTPPYGHGGPSYGQGPGGYNPDGPPTSPPPAFIPQSPQYGYAVDPGSMRRCLHRYTYVWLQNGRSFWFYPTYIGRRSAAGYRWRVRTRRWEYYGINLELIRSFQCH